MKKFITLTFILILAASTAFAGGNKDKSDAGKKVKEGGSTSVVDTVSSSTRNVGHSSTSTAVINVNASRNLENTIIIYTSMYESVIESLSRELQKQFPNYNIEFVYGGSGVLQTRIEAERGSGTLGCDILLVAEPSYSIEMKANGMLHNYKSKEAPNLAYDYDPDGCWYPVRISKMVLAFNPDKNARGTLPASFQGFANDAGVKDAISMSSPLTSGTSTAAVSALIQKYNYDYYAALAKQNVSIDAGAVAIKKLESGEIKIAMILEESILKHRQEEKSKLEVIYPSDGCVIIPSTIMIINNKWSANKNAAAAEAVSDWFLSPAGQNAIVGGYMHSARVNFNRPAGAAPTDSYIKVDWDFVFRQRDMIRIRFEDQVINARR
jgi:iron(III) transport system substrate-binding protein